MPIFVFTTNGDAVSPVPGGAPSAAGDVALRDEALDTITGDVVLNGADGDQLMIYGIDGIASDLKAAWQTVKGESFLDLNDGLDWYGIVFGRRPDLGAITQEFRRVALTVPGIVALRKFIPSIDTATRTLSADYEAEANTGLVFGEQNAVLAPSGG